MGMCRLLKRQKDAIVSILMFLVGIIIVCVKVQFLWLTLLLFCGCCIILLNIQIRKKLDAQADFSYRGRPIRNVDYLIIGDLIRLDFLNSMDYRIVQILSPDRTLEGAFWVLKRTFSLVNEESGKVIIAIKKNNIEKKHVSIFEYPFLSNIHKNILGITNLERKRRYPLFYSPIISLKLIIGHCHTSYPYNCPSEEILTFCQERGLCLEFRMVE